MKVVAQVRQELKAAVDPAYKEGSKTVFFKGDQCHLSYGVRTPKVRKIARRYYSTFLKQESKGLVFSLAQQLWTSNYMEEAIIASGWVWRRRNEFIKRDFAVFERWVKKYVNNWAKCDDFCTHSVGFLLEKYPELMKKSFSWTRSSKRFVKRSAAVSLIYPIRHKNILPDVFRVAKALLEDEDDLVQKGSGWLLKVAADFYRQEVFEFVMEHKAKMPRTALRYAIEKMAQKNRLQAMS
ncbi:DNA alkylation repair protein [Patescibacteria group bacterium]|nr:DNA alkylation repair protein [Patescibacteria group bacterium]